MIRRLLIAGTALCGGILLAPQAVQAQQTIDALGLTVTTTPAVMTDYNFRGLSQTRGRPAAQLTLDVEHSSGFYVGGFVSNVTFAQIDARQEFDFNGGYRFELGGVKFDLGGIYYWYPGYDIAPGAYDLSFFEFVARASYETAPFKLVGQVAYSPNFTGESGNSLYIEGGIDITTDSGFIFSPRIGYQWVERNFPNPANPVGQGAFGAQDYLNVSFAVSREIYAGFIGTLTGVYNSLSQGGGRSDCFGGSKICDSRLIFAISRPF